MSRNCAVSLFHLHLKMYTNSNNSLWRKSIRQSSSAPSKLYFSQGNFTRWKHNITILWRYLKVIWKFFVKSNKKTTPYSPHNVFFSFLTKWASNVRMFRYTLLKWMNYKNRLVFAYYNILRFYCFKIPISRYFFQ